MIDDELSRGCRAGVRCLYPKHFIVRLPKTAPRAWSTSKTVPVRRVCAQDTANFQAAVTTAGHPDRTATTGWESIAVDGIPESTNEHPAVTLDCFCHCADHRFCQLTGRLSSPCPQVDA
jgi:hypothetical protein